MNKHDKFKKTLDVLEKQKNFRKLQSKNIDGLINLSSNDYLNLNAEDHLRDEFRQSESYKQLTFSATSTRLLTGNINQYTSLEATLASLYQREACLIYSSGYHANIGILPALADKKDLIVADKEVHASIIDAMQLSKAKSIRYKHLDLAHLERILEKERSHYENVFIVTESIFSMDGLRVDLPRLLTIKQKYHAYIYLDEAHALGIFGRQGLGLAEEMGYINNIDFIVGTFGKSLASVGAFVVCDELIKDYLVNRSRTLIYTSGLPPINLAWTEFLLKKMTNMVEKRNHIHEIWRHFAKNLGLKAESHIVPYILGNNYDVIEFAKFLQAYGFYVLPIRHPTVAKGTERIRFSFHAALTKAMLDPLFDIFYKYQKNAT